MYNYNQVIQGITNYLDKEIVDKIIGWKKWVFGAGVGIMLSKSTDIFNQIKNNNLIKSLQIIDKEDKIDVDLLYTYLKKEADKGAITFDTPGLGALTLTADDVDKLYNYIKNNES